MTRARLIDVEVSASVEDRYDLTEEQEAFIEASIAEIQRGEYVDGDEMLAKLRRRRKLK